LAVTVEGDQADFLGVNIDWRSDGTIHLSQPHLIDQILEDLSLNGADVKSRSTTAASSKLQTRHTDSEPFDNSFNYRSVIGKLNYLLQHSVCRPPMCKVCIRSKERTRGRGAMVRLILVGNAGQGTIMKPMSDKDLEVFVDASFCGNWDPKEAATDRNTARSRHGYIIKYAGYPLLWKLQVQTEVALSSTESDTPFLAMCSEMQSL
jgi:hypothetical protein